MSIDQHVRELLKAMSEGVYEKEHILAMSLLSAVAGESIFLLGPPGTAKSLVARRLKMIFKDGRAFEYLMSRFSTPDEIFGPVSISLLKSEDRYERVVDGFLPTATVVFLDEIWKAGPSIQNALLTAINERIFQNGRTTLQLPMKALIAASNELPAENEGLEALWDRFLVRMISNCIQSENVFYKMIRQKNTNPKPIPEYLLITEELYNEWQKRIEEISIPNDILLMATYLRRLLKMEMEKEDVVEMDYYISDRRWKKCFHLLQASAFLNGRKSVDMSDFVLLIHCLWNNSDTIPTIIDMVCNSLTSSILTRITQCKKAIDKALNSNTKASASNQPIDEDNYILYHYFYYNVQKYPEGKTFFYKLDYNHIPARGSCDGVIYYDDSKQAYIVHAIYAGGLYDYKANNPREIKKIHLARCKGGLIIDNVPYAFQTKSTPHPEPALFQKEIVQEPNAALKVLSEIRKELFVKLDNMKSIFDDFRNIFLSDDDVTLARKYISECEKNVKELEVKAENASLLL